MILVRAGRKDLLRGESWGTKITVADPAGLHSDRDDGGGYSSVSVRKPNRLRRLAARILFCPDPTVIWAKRAAVNPAVLEKSQGASSVISSSPPESAHVASCLLSKRLKSNLIVDLRDGWLDEPLRIEHYNLPFQQYREARLERHILKQAGRIFVTSQVWSELMQSRLPFTRSKMRVLTNGYPPGWDSVRATDDGPCPSDGLCLIYAGRFTGSRVSRRPSRLLEPLCLGLRPLP